MNPGSIPKARTEGIIVQGLPEETLVYDVQRHKAHCLGGTLSRIWRLCDGRRTVGDIASLLGRETAIDEEVVSAGLRRLSRARLFEEPLTGLSAATVGTARREVLRRMALIGGLSLLSVAAPTAAQAASCTPTAQCIVLVNAQCTGLPCCENLAQKCRPPGAGQLCTCR